MTKIFYASHYGATKQYAEWISEKVNCSCIEVKKAKKEDFLECDTIVFGGGLYAGGINGVKTLKKYLPILKGKHLIIFTVGLAEADDANALIEQTFTTEQRQDITFFHLRGFMDEKN